MIWKSVTGWPYLVSSCGLIFSPARKVPHFCKAGFAVRRPRILKQKTTMYGYKTVVLQNKKNKKHAFVHRLVAAAHIGPRPEGKVINHKDGIKTNNHVKNLEYVTQKENAQHAVDTGLNVAPRGSAHGRSKLTEKSVLKIRELNNLSLKQLAIRFKVTEATISNVRKNKNWTHI